MIRVCGWCKKTMGIAAPVEDTRTTHGICERCATRFNEDDKNLPDRASLDAAPNGEDTDEYIEEQP